MARWWSVLDVFPTFSERNFPNFRLVQVDFIPGRHRLCQDSSYGKLKRWNKSSQMWEFSMAPCHKDLILRQRCCVHYSISLRVYRESELKSNEILWESVSTPISELVWVDFLQTMPILDKIKSFITGGGVLNLEQKGKARICDFIKRGHDPEEIWKAVGELGDGAFGKVYKVTSYAWANLMLYSSKWNKI